MREPYVPPVVDAEDQWRIYELLHGASLANRHLEAVLASGREKQMLNEHQPDLFAKYPRLGAAVERAEQALFDLYQEVGCHWFPEKTIVPPPPNPATSEQGSHS